MATAPCRGKKCISTLVQLEAPIKAVFISQVYHTVNPTTIEYGQHLYPAIEIAPTPLSFFPMYFNGLRWTQPRLLIIIFWQYRPENALKYMISQGQGSPDSAGTIMLAHTYIILLDHIQAELNNCLSWSVQPR